MVCRLPGPRAIELVRSAAARVPGLSALPSDYLKRLYVDTVCPQELTVETSVRFYGDRHVMYGTDYPCWQPSAAVRVLENADLSADQRELIRKLDETLKGDTNRHAPREKGFFEGVKRFFSGGTA